MFIPTAILLTLLPPTGNDALDQLVERQCVACHTPPAEFAERLPLHPASTLTGVGGRVRASWLSEHLAAPSTAHPDLVSGLDADSRHALVDFLAARSGPFETAPQAIDPSELERGRQLYHSVGCVACHAPLEIPEDLEYPLWSFTGVVENEDGEPEPLEVRGLSLDHLPEKTGREALTAYLLDPLATRPDGAMPSLRLTHGEARAISNYLMSPEVRIDGPGFRFASGLIAEYYEKDDPANVDGMEAVRTTVVPDFTVTEESPQNRGDHFHFRFRGFVEVPADGLWTFWTKSDDGSRLDINGQRVVDNWGDHGPTAKSGELWLEEGRHAIEVTFYERGGGHELTVSWSGPGTERASIPAAALGHWETVETPEAFREPAPIAEDRGAEIFTRLSCGACHAMDGVAAPQPAKPLIELDPGSGAGCLGDSPSDGVPRFAFGDGERADLADALTQVKDPSNATRDDAARVEHTLDRLNCRSCHERGGSGGPGEEHGLYFNVFGDLDLGDEGRLPPSLDDVGWKLKPNALAGVLLDGEGVRPYMRTRMPDFGTDNVAHLIDAFTRIDARPPTPAPEFEPRDVELGRQLAARGALGCVQCHDIAGHEGLGIPAADLAYVHERIRYGWFQELLLHPEDIGMNSRMPYFFTDGKSPAVDVYGGDPLRQTEALWSWLALGAALPLPDGIALDGDEYEQVPIDRVITTGVFFRGASARTVVVGFPQRVHYAFDVENSTLAAAWKGRFYNAEGTWHGRAGKLEDAMGEDPIRFPRGIPFWSRGAEDGSGLVASWPTQTPDQLGYRVLGRRVAVDGRPTFRYAFPTTGGERIEVAEEVEPIVMPGAMGLKRKLTLRSPSGTPFLAVFRAGAGEEVTALGGDEFLIDGHLRVAVAGGRVVETSSGADIRVPIEGTEVEMEVQLRW